MEKRSAHAAIVFPGGVGRAEEVLYILGILLHHDNKSMLFPLIFSQASISHRLFSRK